MSAHHEECAVASAVGQDMSVTAFWGENLQAAQTHPILLDTPNKVVLTPHVYGPSVHNQRYFSDPAFPANMPKIWRTQWAHVTMATGSSDAASAAMGIGAGGAPPIVIGEWGGRYNGPDQVWQDQLAALLAEPTNRIAGSFYW